MARIAVQIGHVNGQSGAAYEEATLLLVFPHVVERLISQGHIVGTFDGSLQNEPGNWQYDYDGAIFLHCDSWSTSSSGFSIGYWEEVHPGSFNLAQILYRYYLNASGLSFGGYNITIDEAHYYGNRRFTQSCRCTLIELGFVSNPSERAFLQTNAQKLGYAVADAYNEFFGGSSPKPIKKEEDDMFFVVQPGKPMLPIFNLAADGERWIKIANPGPNYAKVRIGVYKNNKSMDFGWPGGKGNPIPPSQSVIVSASSVAGGKIDDSIYSFATIDNEIHVTIEK